MRIAFVEDDRQLRASVTRGLREAGYTVDEAGTGTQALALIEAHPYDAVILDILIPEPDGIAVCRAVRARGQRVPILMLTALDAVEQRITGLDAGADDYLTKPFDFRELLARVRALVRRGHEPTPDELSIGDLVIDTTRRQVTRGSKTIALTAREYSLLVYMVRNAGRVIQRAELMREVWGEASGMYSNILDVYASRLRRKLGDDDRAPLFATVRGAGFFVNDTPPARERKGERSASRRR